MNLDELKTAWKEYDVRLKATASISDRIVVSMIRERSSSRLEGIRKQYRFFIALSFAWLLVFTAVIAGNPFDFIYRLQYAPAIVYMACFAATIMSLIARYKYINTELDNASLETSLRKLAELYEHPGRFKRWSGLLFLFSAFLFSLSFLPALVNGHGAWIATAVICLQAIFCAVVYLVASALGAFSERHGTHFRQSLEELKELKLMSRELSSDD